MAPWSWKTDQGGLQHHKSHLQPPPPKNQRTYTAPEAPTLLRLPSTSSAAASSRLRRANSTNGATSPSYFSPQPNATTTRRPPASYSGHGIDNSRGPPVTLVTRGKPEIPRRTSQTPADLASTTQQQPVQSGLLSPALSHGSSRRGRGESPQTQQMNTPTLSRRNTTSTAGPARDMASSADESSDYDSGPRSHFGDYRAAHTRRSGEKEDLFLNIAADSAPRQRPIDTTTRIDRLKSRVARVNNRQSLPPTLQHSPSPVHSNSTTPTGSRLPSTDERRSTGQPRRSSLLPASSRDPQDRPPLPPPHTTPRTRDLSHKASFSSRKDTELSPRDFLATFGGRRSSQPENIQTPPSRTGYRPSNLNYSSTREGPRTPRPESVYDTPPSRNDGTESQASTGPATSVWDELDELKTRIRKIELGGKIPATSGQIVSQASADRPRTANTSATTVSSSPNQYRKSNLSPPESTVDPHSPSTNRIHPLLRDALAKARQHISPSVYRVLEATASEALTLAEMTGSAGPQGTLHSASSILGGSGSSDRQVRRKADNICRSLTELCITMCDSKTGLPSPAFRSPAAISRRPSVQINGDSPTIRQSVETESNSLSGVSPSRALSRIEARRSSMLIADTNGSHRNSRADLLDERQTPSRLQRAGTSLHRTRGSTDDDEDEPTIRPVSRAMTDFRTVRQPEQNRYSSSRQYTSREPMPDLQPSPAMRPTSSLRRPTVTGVPNENRNSLLFRGERNYDFTRESSPAYEKQMAGNLRARAELSAARTPNRNSIGGVSDLRSVSLGRRMRGASTGE